MVPKDGASARVHAQGRCQTGQHAHTQPEAKKSQAIGLRGLLWLLAGIIIGPLSIYMFTTALKWFSMGMIIGAIFLFILTIVVAFYTIILGFLNGLVCSIYQLRLNKRPLGWIDLVLTLLLVVEVAMLLVWLSKT